MWGDHPGESWALGETDSWTAREAWEKTALHLPGWVFTAAWALLAIGVGVWAARTNRRWVVTTAATFFAINFYTQWFERLGGEPWVVIIAGLTILGIAVGLWRYNTAPTADAWSAGADA